MDWAPIPGFDGYEAHPSGQIRSWVRRDVPLVLKPGKLKGGYEVVSLRDKTYRLSRLILMTFARLPEEGWQAAHLDGNPSHNSLDNLAWKTRTENEHDKHRHGSYGHRRRITFEQYERIWDSSKPKKVIAREEGVDYSLVCRIKKGTYKCAPLIHPRPPEGFATSAIS